MPDSQQRNIIDLIKRSNKILVLPSSPPDGDSLGSAVALYLVLKKMQKEVTVLCSDPVPEVYDFLPNMQIIGDKLTSTNDFIITLDCRHNKIEKIQSSIENDKINIIITPDSGSISEQDISFTKGKLDYELIITVDTAELSQLRDVYEKNIEMFNQIPVINIDHHVSNTHFGKINYVDIMASSATELLLPLIEEMAKEEDMELIDEDVATLLLTGIITDTGSFQNANTTPRSFQRASQLIAYGARQQEIIQFIYKTKQLSQLKLWGRVLSKIQTDEKYRIVWSLVSQQDFRDTASSEDETGDIIDELMTNAPGAEVILLMKERKDGTISVSVRTTTPAADAAKIAESFGGGGHTQAAGFRLENSNLRDAEHSIINAVKAVQAERLNLFEEEESSIIPKFEEPQPTEDTKSIKKKAPAEDEAPAEPFKPKSPEVKIKDKDTEIKPGVIYKFED